MADASEAVKPKIEELELGRRGKKFKKDYKCVLTSSSDGIRRGERSNARVGGTVKALNEYSKLR